MEGYEIINGKVAISNNYYDYRNGIYLDDLKYSYDLLSVYSNASIFGDTYLDGSNYIYSFDNYSASISNLGIGISFPSVPFQITKYTTRTSQKVSAVLENAVDHWTYFRGLTGERISGSTTDSLKLEGNPSGTGDKSVYINSTVSGKVIMASGGGFVGIGTETPVHKLDVKGNLIYLP